MPVCAILLDIGSQHEIVFFDDIIWVVDECVSENKSPPILHFADDFNVTSRQLHLLVENVLEVFLSALTICRLGLAGISRGHILLFLVEVMILVAHVE